MYRDPGNNMVLHRNEILKNLDAISFSLDLQRPFISTYRLNTLLIHTKHYPLTLTAAFSLPRTPSSPYPRK